jgi:putative hydrolase of the HAD superfamily
LFTNIKHIFFDLDRTLWDFKANSRATLSEVYTAFNLQEKGIRSAMDFIKTYEKINERMWDLYRRGELSKEKLRYGRFQKTLLLFGIKNELIGKEIGQYYIKHSPYKVGLFDHSHEILTFLKKNYQLHVITNGFEEVQHVKLRESKLLKYFDKIITSEAASAKKPDPKIFEYAESDTGAQKENCLIIGDDLEADIKGGIASGWKVIHFDPHREFDKVENVLTIHHLQELEKHL